MSFTGKWYGFGQDPDFDAGLHAFETKEYEAAAASFRAVMGKRGNEDLKSQARSFLVSSLSSMGRQEMEDGHPMESREAYLQAIELEPRYPDLWLGLALAAGRLGDDATEKGSVQKARALNPNYARAILYEGLMALKSGDAEKALAVLRQLPEGAAPSGPDDLLIEALEATFLSGGDEANAIASQADEATREHQFDIAAALYRQAAQLRPRYADIRCKLGQVLLELDHLEEAEAHLRTAIEINPKYADAWAQLGIALKRQHHREEAREAFLKAYELDRFHPIAKLEIKRPL